MASTGCNIDFGIITSGINRLVSPAIIVGFFEIILHASQNGSLFLSIFHNPPGRRHPSGVVQSLEIGGSEGLSGASEQGMREDHGSEEWFLIEIYFSYPTP